MYNHRWASQTCLFWVLGITSLVAAVLGIVPIALTGTGGANKPDQFTCYLAFDIIAIIVLIAGAILAFVLACKDIYNSYPMVVVMGVIIPFGFICYIIATACYFPPVKPSPGSWLLSALWAAFPPALTAIIYIIVRPDRWL